MKKLMLITLLAISFPALALEKCIINGKTVYKQMGECPQGGKLPKPSDKFNEIEASKAKQEKIERNAAIAARNAKQDAMRVMKEDVLNWKR